MLLIQSLVILLPILIIQSLDAHLIILLRILLLLD